MKKQYWQILITYSPDGNTTAYGDAKHARLRFSALELLISQYRKYNRIERENLITGQLKRFIEDDAYSREKFNSLFQLFYYVEELNQTPPAGSIAELISPTFYSPNVSWTVQREWKLGQQWNDDFQKCFTWKSFSC